MDKLDQFQDIRPYKDDEVRPVLDSLLADNGFISSVGGFSRPRLYKALPFMVRYLTRKKLSRELKDVHDIAGMQTVIARYMDEMIEKTTSSLTHSGLENLKSDRSYLFISNHRDIAMDPAFVNYMLYHAGCETVYIAIGDNLLKRPFVNDLMRLNKSFIVRRSLKGRELLKSSKQLSAYIHHCIDLTRNVWIAQREGRAKDGVDRTDPALLKMLGMSKRDEGLGAALSALHIVPVAISYEFDPCDVLKANELYQRKEAGSYQKDEQSDIHSIVTGMVGYKGHVHVSFGKELEINSDDPEHIASQIDQQIIDNYLLQIGNYLALEKLQQSTPELVPMLNTLPLKDAGRFEEAKAEFEKRLQAVDEKIRPYLLQMYANPVISRYAATQEDPFSQTAVHADLEEQDF